MTPPIRGGVDSMTPPPMRGDVETMTPLLEGVWNLARDEPMDLEI